MLGEISQLIAAAGELGETLSRVAEVLGGRLGYRLVVISELRDTFLVPCAAYGMPGEALPIVSRPRGPSGTAVSERRVLRVADLRSDPRQASVLRDIRAEICLPVSIGEWTWGVLLVGSDRAEGIDEDDAALLGLVADQIGGAADKARLLERVRHQLDQSDALRRVTTDIGSRLDLPLLLAELVDHGMTLFRADRGAVFQRGADGTFTASVARGLSVEYLDSMRQLPQPSLAGQAIEGRHSTFATAYADDLRGGAGRSLVLQEGFDTVAIAPLLAEDEVLGLLTLYHDRHRAWPAEDLDALDALAVHASLAIHNARTYAQMATWAAHLGSIQHLGVRLSQLSSVREIGLAIAGELRELIDYHNVRVYRLEGEELIPVAWRGEIGQYTEEDETALRTTIGQGITGWVAQHGIAQNLPDADKDPRTRTIPGTEDIDESMLVAPMLHEDRVLGVIALSKLGLRQFSADDMRLLEIYALFAAQAMANADATARLRAKSEVLERQLRGQQELLRVTETLLTTLDRDAVLEEIAERLSALVGIDHLGILLHDPVARLLRPTVARGIDAARFMAHELPDDEGLPGIVLRDGEAQLAVGEGPSAGSLIVSPLRGRGVTAGVLVLERLRPGATFSDEEFEQVKLFAAQASIALQNAAIHHAVTLRAQTDGLTGLSNHGTFQERLVRAVAQGETFSLLMLDLDDFKRYNDRLGHQPGDALLQQIAAALRAAVRDGDSVYRYGGDEFAVLLPATDTEGAAKVAEKLRRAVCSAARAMPQATRDRVTCSIGLATFPNDGITAEAVLLNADRASYASKRAGRDRVTSSADAAPN